MSECPYCGEETSNIIAGDESFSYCGACEVVLENYEPPKEQS